MYKLTVVTDPEVADGFRLSGVDVRVAFSPEEARQIVSELMDDPEIGIIGLDVRLESGIDLRLQRKIDSVYRPVVVTLPLGDRLDTDSGASDRLARMIRRAVGFDVTLKRG